MSNENRSGKAKALFVSVEFVSVLVLVALFFVGILGIMAFSFPAGKTLQDLVRYERMLAESAAVGEFEMAPPEGEVPRVAMLSSTH